MSQEFDRDVLTRLPLAEAVLSLWQWACHDDHLADLYDRYAVHRPQMLRAWARGEDTDAGGRALQRVRSVQVLNIVAWRYPAPATTLGSRLGLEGGERFEPLLA